MTHQNIPPQADLPSTNRLIKSTILAIFIAAVLLVTVVLPAEYGLDPTGFGEFIGLKKMGEIKVSLSQELEAEEPIQLENLPAEENISEPQVETQPEPPLEPTLQEPLIPNDTMTLTLKPNEGKEIKMTMVKGAQITYSWWTDNGKANYDAHADSKILKIKYHGYTKGAEERSEGTLEAAFDGQHGWFWRNRTSTDMTVTLKVSGEYTDIGFVN